MPTLATQIRFLLMGHKRTSQILPMIILLIMIYFVVRWASSPNGRMGAVWQGDDDLIQFNQLDDQQIKTYIDAMQDVRSDSCKKAQYEIRHDDKVSIILDFNEHQFYDLKLTLTSIIEHTPSKLYEEIILLDDGTSTDRVREDAIQFLAHERFKKVKPFRSEDKHGPSASRFKAARVATGNILVFIHSKVAVNKGWLRPLIHAIEQNRKQIVIPHMDNLLSGYRFFKTPDNLAPVFSWTLDTLFIERMESDSETTIPAPVMTGAVFAVEKEFLDYIGNYDDTMATGGGENLELSLRTWMCGGAIHIVRCSRVAQHNALVPLKISSNSNIQRITELWLPEFRQIIYQQSNTPYEKDAQEQSGLKLRQNYYSKELKLQCKDASWFVREMARYIQKPKPNFREFGKLKSKTGFCLTKPDDSTYKLAMVMCKPHLYESNAFVDFLENGQLANHDRCLEYDSAKDILSWKTCQMGVEQQQWTKTANGQIHVLKDSQKCLSHMPPDGSADEHEVRIRACDESASDRNQLWEIIKY